MNFNDIKTEQRLYAASNIQLWRLEEWIDLAWNKQYGVTALYDRFSTVVYDFIE